jgi:CRISPR-associated protein Csx3
MASIFPAILIGGPPHSGKSTLTYRLRAALSERGVTHYVLRAHPDGEGNWHTEVPRSVVKALRERAKRPWSEELARLVSRDIGARHLPLLVDVGGVVSAENEMIAAQCTHAILIAHDWALLEPWRELAAAQGLGLVAELRSVLDGPSSIIDRGATLRGDIGGLGEGLSSEGATFDALIERIAQICAYDADELYRAHLALTDVELVLHVEQAIYPLPAHGRNGWRPEELPALVASLPPPTPLGVYGIGPGWLYAALAAASHPARFVLFDPRLGWVEPPPLAFGDAHDPKRLLWRQVEPAPQLIHLKLDIPGPYLDYDAAPETPIPRLPADRGVILDGRLPHWLVTALARAYADTPWVAVYQPQLAGAVVVRSRDPAVALGSVLK